MREWLARNIKWLLGTFISLMLFFVFGLPQISPAYSDWLDGLFADISVKATPQYAIPSSNKTYVRYQTNPLRIQVLDWTNVRISWPNIIGASEYMVRANNGEYPFSTMSGTLVYQGTLLSTTDKRTSNVRYTLFYKNAAATWVTAYRGHIEGN